MKRSQVDKDWCRRCFADIIGRMKTITWTGPVLAILLFLAGCSQQPEMPSETPTPSPTRSSSPSPSAEPVPIPTNTPRPLTATPSPVVETATLSKPLFLLSDKAVWVIRPGETVVQRLTPPEFKVTCFAVWPGDNRLIYGTDTGQVYLARDTSNIQTEPVMLFDAFPDAPYLVRMDSLSWSSDGKRLAFSVDYSSPGASQTAGYPSPPSGLWLYEMDTRQATWVESNRYLSSNQSDINLLRRLMAGAWSPDGTGLLLHGVYWEGSDILLLEAGSEDNLLLDPPGDLWGSASWTPDSQAILLSGQLNSPTSDLVLANRDELEPVQLIDGEASRLYVYDAVDLPSGTAFLANCSTCAPDQTRLYMGHRVGEKFVWTAVNMHQNCTGGAPRFIQWDPEGITGAMDCGGGELRAIQFQIDNVAELNMSSYLNPLANSEIIKLAWGGEE
jgi:hypothetical protein